MNPAIAQICVADRGYAWPDWQRPEPSLWERTLSFFFPPRKLSELGKIDGSSLGYCYRMERTSGIDTPTKYTDSVRIGKVTVGQAKRVPRPGTRESRWSWRDE